MAQGAAERSGIMDMIILILMVALTTKSFVNLGKFVHHSGPEFPHVRKGNSALLTS